MQQEREPRSEEADAETDPFFLRRLGLISTCFESEMATAFAQVVGRRGLTVHPSLSHDRLVLVIWQA